MILDTVIIQIFIFLLYLSIRQNFSIETLIYIWPEKKPPCVIFFCFLFFIFLFCSESQQGHEERRSSQRALHLYLVAQLCFLKHLLTILQYEQYIFRDEFYFDISI